MARHILLIALACLFAACGDDSGGTQGEGDEPPSPTEPEAATSASDELFPDVIAAQASQDSRGSWTFDVTISSPYDSAQRYADAWRVLAPDGSELGLRVLAHDHASEQPFTRSLTAVEIPDDVDSVIIEGRDQISGWGGATLEITLNR